MTIKQNGPLACFSDDLRKDIEQHFLSFNESCEDGDEIELDNDGVYLMIREVVEDGPLDGDSIGFDLPDNWKQQIREWCVAHDTRNCV